MSTSRKIFRDDYKVVLDDADISLIELLLEYGWSHSLFLDEETRVAARFLKKKLDIRRIK